MLRSTLITAIVLTGLLQGTLLYFMMFGSAPEPTLTQQTRPIEHILEEPEVSLPDLVHEINQRNSQIQTFTCDDVAIKTWERGIKVRLKAELHYEKDLSFRMILDSVFGKELDLGSNDKMFWYWSRRDKHPGLYWSFHEDFYKTRLKTPFNPMFMRDTLGLNEIPQEGAKVGETEGKVIIVYEKYDSMMRPILYTIVINKTYKVVEGILVTDMGGNPLAVAEIKEHQNGLPAEILYTWYEEDKVLLLRFNNPKVNQSLSSNLWTPPNETPKIDMSKE